MNSKQWDTGRGYKTVEQSVVAGKRKTVVHSISGHERNKLFMNVEGRGVVDASMQSNADSIADSRCFAIWDFDHDGQQDLLLVNVNDPHIEIFRNRTDRQAGGAKNFIAVRFVGGKSKAEASSDWTNRNGFGAIVTAEAGGKTILREHRCGDGFSSQNSSTLIVGVDEATVADKLTVKWPSGKSQQALKVPVGSLVTFYEDAKSSAKTDGIEVGQYVAARKSNQKSSLAAGDGLFSIRDQVDSDMSKNGVHVLIALETWCPNCINQHKGMSKLIDRLDPSTALVYGLPTDLKDTEDVLQDYAKKHGTPFSILSSLSSEKRELAKKYLRFKLGADVLPATIITDHNGNVLDWTAGIPDVSRIRRLVKQRSGRSETTE